MLFSHNRMPAPPALILHLHKATASSALSVLMFILFCEQIVALDTPMLTPTLCYTSYNCNNDIKRKEIAVQVCDGSVHSRPSWCPTAERTALVLRGGGDAVTDYERERQEKLKKNQAMLASLGLSQGGATSLGINKPKKKPRPRRLAVQTATQDPTRRSIRNLGKDKVKYTESSQESADSSASVESDEEDEEMGSDDDYEDDELDPPSPARSGRARGRPRLHEDDEESARSRIDAYRCPAWAPRDAVATLYLRLLDLRSEIADKNGIKAHMVAHDRSLWEMAVYTPLSQRELVGCWGFSAQKASMYGADFIVAIRAYKPFWTTSMPSYYRLNSSTTTTTAHTSYGNPGLQVPRRTGLSYPVSSTLGSRRPPFVVKPTPTTSEDEDEPSRPVPGSIFVNGTWHAPGTLPVPNTPQRFGAGPRAATTPGRNGTLPPSGGHAVAVAPTASGHGVQRATVTDPEKTSDGLGPGPLRGPLSGRSTRRGSSGSSTGVSHVQREPPRAAANGRKEDSTRAQLQGT